MTAVAMVVVAAIAAFAPGMVSRPGPGVADGGCVAGDAGGVIHCQGVLDNSLNDISVHILGH